MFKTALIPVDITVASEAEKLLAAAKTLTAGWDGRLHVAMVVPDIGMAIVGSFFDKSFESESQSAASGQLSAAIAAVGLEAKQNVQRDEWFCNPP